MALWGDKDNINSVGTVELDYSTLVVTGTGTSFGQVGSASTGDVIRFGTYPDILGDAVVVGIASDGELSIASTAGLSGAAIAGEEFSVSQSPKYVVLDSSFNPSDDKTSSVYGVAEGGVEASSGTVFETGVGWVGITTYLDSESNLRVKKEILVAMSGIQTGNTPLYDANPLV